MSATSDPIVRDLNLIVLSTYGMYQPSFSFSLCHLPSTTLILDLYTRVVNTPRETLRKGF